MKLSNLVRAFVLANTLWAAAAMGQAVPQTVAFTGNLNGSGGPVTGAQNFVFRLYDAPTGGTVAWTETQNNLQVTNGLFYATLGSVTPFTPGILNGAALYLEVTVGATSLSPRLAINSVPYAMRAGVSQTANTLGPLMPSDVQRRVAGVCSGANAVQTIDAMGNVTCVAVAGGAGDITSITTAAGSGLTGGVLSGDATLAVDGTVQRRGAAPNDLSCGAGRYVQGISATGAAICAPDSDTDTGVNAVTSGSGITASIAARNLTINNTGVLSVSSANAFITATVAAGAASITANVGSVANTLAAGNHGHNLNCGTRSIVGAGLVVTANCVAGETVIAGGCDTDGTLQETRPVCAGFCLCPVGNKCFANSWRCSRTGGTTMTATAMCCDTPVRGNVP